MTLGVTWQRVLPKDLVSACVYRVARSRRVWLKNALIDWFARTYRIDWTEAERGSRDDYATFNEFFARALRDGARPLAGDAHTVIAPADGRLTEWGTIRGDTLLQAKGMSYTVAELLGEDGADFRDGEFLTVYLAPHNYHRVHMPTAGTLLATRYLPGERFCVNTTTAAAIARLFCRNERVVCRFATPRGAMAVVMVGALNVSSVSLVSRGEIASGAARHWLETPPLELARGAELGRFNLGSTAIVLLARGVARWDAALAAGTEVRMGAALGRLLPRNA